MLEIQTLTAFEAWLDAPYMPAAVQALDLRRFKARLRGKSFMGSLFLSCKLCRDSSHAIVKGGGVIIPDSPSLSFPAHQKELYSVEALFAGYKGGLIKDYRQSYDYKIYREFMRDGKLDTPLHVGMFRYLHDHSITDALYNAIRGKKVVAIMGGHGMERRDAFYSKIARLSRGLTRAGYLMVSGGGPGAMEAAHLGAYFAGREDSDMTEAIAQISVRPKRAKADTEYADEDWLKRAWDMRQA